MVKSLLRQASGVQRGVSLNYKALQNVTISFSLEKDDGLFAGIAVSASWRR